MKIDKSELMTILIELANAINESAAKLGLNCNKDLYGRIYEFSIALRTPAPKFEKIVCLECDEVYGYHVVRAIKLNEQRCFLLGDTQAGLIIKKIGNSQDFSCEKDGESDE